MNKVILIGRITKNVELNQTQNGTAYVSNSIAVNRNYKNADGSISTDFINFVAYKSTAELMARYVNKGDRIGLTGSWNVRSYQNQQGQTQYVNELLVENIEFLQDKPQPQQQRYQQPNNPFQQQTQQPQQQSYASFNESDLPF